MTRHWKKLLLEMAAIVLVAVAAGLIWNQRMLRDVYSRKAAAQFVPSGSEASPAAAPAPAGLAQVKDLLDRKEAVIVDAREESVFRAGHIKGAVSLPVGEFESRAAGFQKEFPADVILVVYCGGYGCHNSRILGEKLAGRGYKQILIYEGGYPEWKDAGLPIEVS